MIAIRNTMLILALTLTALAAHAQGFYYQSIMPDGRTVIGDEPAPGAKEVRKMPLAKGNVSAPVSSPAQPGGIPQQQALDSADATVRQAQQQLEAAKAALEGSREPLPGERIGIAGGGSRLTDAYFQRVKKLEDNVTAAQRRLDDAHSTRGSIR